MNNNKTMGFERRLTTFAECPCCVAEVTDFNNI